MGHSFIIPYGEDKEHAAALQRGLAVLGEEYAARLCFACSGRGQYNQTYTAGCGGGYFQSMGPCAFILTVFALAAGVVAAFLRSVGGLR